VSWRKTRPEDEHWLLGRFWWGHRPLLWMGDLLTVAWPLGRLRKYGEPEMFVELFEDLFESGDIGLRKF